MIKKAVITIFSFVCLFCLTSCEIENIASVEPNIQMLYGDYTLSDVHWSGLSVDLNNDGTGHWDLLYEFQNKIGYYEPDYVAVVNDGIIYSYTEQYAKNATAFNISIPYPCIIEEDGDWKCTGIHTLKYSIRATKDSFHLVSNCCKTCPGFNDPNDLFLSNIQEISLVVKSYDSNTFQVGLYCKLPCVFGNKNVVDDNYLYYEFIKK